MPKKDKQGTEDTPKGGKKGAAEKKEIDPQKYQQARLFERYVEESGLSTAFQIIFAEIIQKKINNEQVFAYTAMRLKQLGEELQNIDIEQVYPRAEVEETITQLDKVLNSKTEFDEVLTKVFESIDTDLSGSIDLAETTEFLRIMLEQMGIAQMPDKSAVVQFFKALDTDNSGSIDKKELGVFLRKVFIMQKDQAEAALSKIKGEGTI